MTLDQLKQLKKTQEETLRNLRLKKQLIQKDLEWTKRMIKIMGGNK